MAFASRECSGDRKNKHNNRLEQKLYKIQTKVVPTYIVSFGWTTIVHNRSFAIEISLGHILNIAFPKFNSIVNEDKVE